MQHTCCMNDTDMFRSLQLPHIIASVHRAARDELAPAHHHPAPETASGVTAARVADSSVAEAPAGPADDVAIPAADSAADAAGGSAAVVVRGPGGTVKPAPLYTVSDSAGRRLQRLLKKLRDEGFALGMHLTAWFQVCAWLRSSRRDRRNPQRHACHVTEVLQCSRHVQGSLFGSRPTLTRSQFPLPYDLHLGHK